MTTTVAAPAASAPSTSSSTPAPSSSPSTSSSPSSNQAPATQTPAATTGESSGASGAPKEVASQAAAKAEEARKWKLKVLGQEREVDEGELVRRAQLGYGADEKFQEAKRLNDTANQFFQQLKADPLSILTHPELGLDFRKMAEEYLAGELKREMLPPEQRELEELREFKRKQEEAAQATEQETLTKNQQREFQEATQRATQAYSTQISESLESSNLPRTPFTIKRVAEVMKAALEKGYEVDVPTAVDMVRDGYMTDFKSLFGGLKGDKLVQFLGDDVLKEVRQFDLARIKAKIAAADPASAAAAAASIPAPQNANQEQKQMKPDEWRDFLRQKAGL